MKNYVSSGNPTIWAPEGLLESVRAIYKGLSNKDLFKSGGDFSVGYVLHPVALWEFVKNQIDEIYALLEKPGVAAISPSGNLGLFQHLQVFVKNVSGSPVVSSEELYP